MPNTKLSRFKAFNMDSIEEARAMPGENGVCLEIPLVGPHFERLGSVYIQE